MVGQVYDFDFEKALRRKEVSPAHQEPQITVMDSTGVTSQNEILEAFKKTARGLVSDFKEVTRAQNESIGTFKINMLPNKEINASIDAILERDGEGFLARTIELPLYGYGSDPIDAIDILKNEIESLYDDLMEDDNFTGDWLRIKNYLRSRIAN